MTIQNFINTNIKGFLQSNRVEFNSIKIEFDYVGLFVSIEALPFNLIKTDSFIEFEIYMIEELENSFPEWGLIVNRDNEYLSLKNPQICILPEIKIEVNFASINDANNKIYSALVDSISNINFQEVNLPKSLINTNIRNTRGEFISNYNSKINYLTKSISAIPSNIYKPNNKFNTVIESNEMTEELKVAA